MAMDFTKGSNASNLKKIQQKSKENSNSVVAIDIALDQIDKNEDNEKIFPMSEIEYLAAGIKDEGFFGAIEVYRKPDGRYEISAGHRRYEAMKYLGRETIPCIVKELPDDITRGKKLLSSNLRNRKLSTMDMARAIDYYRELLKAEEAKKVRQKERTEVDFLLQAVEFFNMSKTQIYRYYSLTKLIPELQELADRADFPFSALQTAVNLTPEGQMELYRQISVAINKADPDSEVAVSRTRIKTIIDNLLSNVKYQKNPKKEENKAKKREEKKESQYVKEEKKIVDNEISGIKELSNNIKNYDDNEIPLINYRTSDKVDTMPAYETVDVTNERINEDRLISEIDVINGIIYGINNISKKSGTRCIGSLERAIEEIKKRMEE